MKSSLVVGLALMALCTTGRPAAAQKEAFIEQKCNKCHTISALGVEKKAGDEEDEEEGATPPDLSHVGKFHDAAWIEGFLDKKTDHVAHEGVTATGKHKVKFKGTPDELKSMATWLATLK